MVIPPLSLIGRSLADPFWKEAILAGIGPIVAAILGGLAVGLIVQYVQNRREFLTFSTALSLDMMQIAYGFYTRLIEVIRQEHYGQEVSSAELPARFEEFRIAARVVEAKLHAYFSDEEARYLWHGVVDMLSVRYYRLTYGADGQRTIDMIGTHGQHPDEAKIPARARVLFLRHDELQDDDKVMRRFEEMLNHAIHLVLNRRLDPSAGGDAILQPGRGSRLKPLPRPPSAGD